jgi:hypothetical protein
MAKALQWIDLGSGAAVAAGVRASGAKARTRLP